MPGYIKKKKNTRKGGKKNTCKRRRVRISENGSYNQSDMKHNKDCERKHKQKKIRRSRMRKTRKSQGGNDEERKKQVEELMKQWKPVKGKGSLPDTAANLTAKHTVELEKKEREERNYRSGFVARRKRG